MLSDPHRKKLAECGLSEETVGRALLHSGSPEEVKAVLGYGTGAGGLVIPYDPIGTKDAYARVRIDNPGPDGKRYRSPRNHPSGQTNRVYFPPTLPEGFLRDVTRQVYVTEGEFKALKATQDGFYCVALPGVWAWKRKLHEKSIVVSDFERVAWRGRVVVVVYDSDAAEKPPVAWAEHELVKELRRRGAKVYVARLPLGERGEKYGLDDFLVARGAAEFKRLPMLTLAEADHAKTFYRVGDLADAYMERVTQVHHRIAFGYSDIDQWVRGLAPGEVLTFAARAGVGKTAFALNLIDRMTAKDQHPTLMLSLEMQGPELFERMASLDTGLDGRKIEELATRADEMLSEQFREVVERWHHVVVVDKPLSLKAMDEAIEQAQASDLWVDPLRLVFVDYLGMLIPDKRGAIYEQVSENAREVKRIAKRHRVGIVLLCQVGRTGESGGVPVVLGSARDSVAGDTRVLLSDGRLVPIADLVGFTPEVVAMSPESLDPVTVKSTRVWCKGEREVIRVKTRTGREVRVTPEHPFFIAECGWVEARGLKPGDRIAAPREVRVFGGGDLTADEGLVLGLLCGDGSLTMNPIEYTDGNASVRAECVAAVRRLGLDPRVKKSDERTLVFSRARGAVGENPVMALIERSGLRGVKSPLRLVPECVETASEPAVAAFVRGLWSTDGCVTSRGLKFVSSSEKLARGVASLLLRFGIRCAVVPEKVGRGGYSGSEGKVYWSDVIRDGVSVGRFAERVGLLGDKHERLCALAVGLDTTRANRNLDCVSSAVWSIIHKLRRARGLPWSVLGRSGVVESRNISLGRLARIAESLDSDRLRVIAGSSTMWDEVVSASPAGRELVYDATVPEYRNYLAEDIYVSNSGVVEESCDHLWGAWRPELHEEIKPDQLDAVRGLMLLAVLKNRMGPAPVTVKLRFVRESLRIKGWGES